MTMSHVQELADEVSRAFSTRWGKETRYMCAAPGRINIIGEHTDYTGGFVLPAAIERNIVAVVGEGSDNLIRGYSLAYQEEATCVPGDYDAQHPAMWFRYVMGVLSELQKTGYPVAPFDFCIGGDIPIGSGLSSSAALEMSVLTAMESFNGYHIEDDEAARICQQAENNFMGVQCGIMDMLISRAGREDCALMIDCSDLSRKYVRISLPGCSWLVIDSGRRRSLVNSEYNKRRAECEAALEAARTIFPEKQLVNLKDLMVTYLPSLEKVLSPKLYKRVKHVVTENERVRLMIPALERADIATAGELLYESHRSLREDYEVSCRELDMLVEIVSGIGGVYGARMMGAGFGGSIIVLVESHALAALEKAVNTKYSLSGFKASILPVKASIGARVIVSC